jgi:membrane protein required for colicin V production
MIWVDNAIAALLIIYTFSGMMRGFSQEIFSLLIWGVAIIVAWFFSHEFTVFLVKVIATQSTRLAASFLALTFITLAFGWIINMLLADAVSKTGLRLMDRLGGMLLGVVHGLVVVFVLVVVAGLTPLPKDHWWQQSKFLPPFQSMAMLVRDTLPSKVAKSIKYR